MCIREDTVTVKGRDMHPGPGCVMLGTVACVQGPRISEGGVFDQYGLVCQLSMMANTTRQLPTQSTSNPMPFKVLVPKQPFGRNVKI